MSSIAGYLDPAGVPSAIITAMARTMRHRPGYVIRQKLEREIGIATLGISGAEGQWAESPDGNHALVCLGSVYEPWTQSGRDVADAALNRFLAEGAPGLTDLNGDYVIAIWSRREQRLTLTNDRLGLRRVHLWRKGQRFAWASELKALATLPDVPQTIDAEALSDLLLLGYLQQDRTMLQEVRLLPAASTAVWQEGRLTVNRYWQPEFSERTGLSDPEEASREYARRLQAAVERRISGRSRIGLPLSGGLDARALAGIIRRTRTGETIRSWTTGHAHSHDVRFAAKMAKVIGSRHTAVSIPETYLQEQAASYVWALDGSVVSSGCHRAYATAPALGASDVVVNGFLGDVLAGTNMLQPLQRETRFSAIADFVWSHVALSGGDAPLKTLLRPEVLSAVRESSRQAMERVLRDVRSGCEADRAGWAAIDGQLSGGSFAQVRLLQLDCEVVVPFADRDFVDFALSLPLAQRMERTAYVRMLCREFPELARVPRAGGGLPLSHTRLHAAAHWRLVWLYRYMLPRVTGGMFGGHAYGNYVHPYEWFRQSNREFITRTLMDQPALEDHFDLARVNRFVADFLDGRPGLAGSEEIIASLVTFALFREQLGRQAARPDGVAERIPAPLAGEGREP